MTFILVDCGYLFFYRYHATKLWYKKAYEYKDDLTMLEDENYQKTFQKKIIDCIQTKIKKYNTNWSRVLFCRDTRKNLVWRNNLTNDYKANRDTSHLTGLALAATIFKQTIFQLCRTLNAKSIGVKTAEADDIVFIAKNLLKEHFKNQKFIIIASDHDYFQTIDQFTILERLDKHNPILKSVRHTHGYSITEALKIDLLIKIIMGDKSDNIPSCFPKCGPKTAFNLAIQPELLEKKLTQCNKAQQRFELNKKLIDMTQIPDLLRQQIIQKVKICFKI